MRAAVDAVPFEGEGSSLLEGEALEVAFLGALHATPSSQGGENREAGRQAVELVPPEAFALPAHRTLYRHLRELVREGERFDFHIVEERLRSAGELKAVGGRAELVRVTSSLYEPDLVLQYAQSLRDRLAGEERRRQNELARKRIGALGSRLQKAAADPASDPAKVWAELLEDAPDVRPEHGIEALTDAEIEALPPPEWIYGEVLAEGGLTMVAAPPGAGKTLLGVDIAQSLQLGIDGVCGKVERARPVVYLLAEGGAAFGPRLRAWRTHRHVCGSTGLLVVRQALQLADPTEVAELARFLRSLPERPGALVVDTVARTFVGFDENSAQDTSRYIAGCDRLRDELGIAILLLHHTILNGERERGSGNWRASVDTMLKLTNTDGLIRLTCEKQKDAEPFRPYPMRLKPVGSSVVLTATDSTAVGDTEPPAHMLETLGLLTSHAPPEGLSPTNWMKVAEKSERTFYRHLSALNDAGYVEGHTAGSGKRYTITQAGREALP